MRDFLYRFPRFRTECRMDLIFGDAVVPGICLDVSESGLRGSFAFPVPAGTEGLLTLYFDRAGEQGYQVHARVYSARNDETRVRFRYKSEQERLDLRELLKLLAPH